MKAQNTQTDKDERQLSQNISFLQGVSIKYILASSLAMLAVYAGAIIDTVIVGAFLSEEGLSAMSLVSPVYLFYYTVGAVIGIGGSVAASHHIGKGDYISYRRVFTFSLLMMLIAAVVITTLGLLFLDQIALALSGKSSNTQQVREYLRYYIMGGGFTLLSYIPLYFLKSDGRPRTSSVLFFIFTLLNIVLTWLFMSDVFRMGIGGASLATAISMAVITLLGLFLLLNGKGESKLAFGGFSLKALQSILITGTPSGLANLFEALRILLINALLIRIGAAVLLPAFTVVRNVLDLLSAVMLGISSAMLPLIGVFYSELDNIGTRTVYRSVLRIGLAVTAVFSLAASLFPGAIAVLFGISDLRIIAEIQYALPLACAGSLLAYVNTQLTGYFNTILRTGLSNLILFLRLLCYLALSAVILSAKFGTLGIWASFSLTEALTFATVCCIRYLMRKKSGPLDRYLLDTSKESSADITFSVQNNIEDVMFASNQISAFCDDNEIPVKVATKVSLAIEEMLMVIITKCMDVGKVSYIDIRVRKLEDGVMLRIRNAGRIFDPVQYYETNKDDEELADDLLGLKLIIGSCRQIDFRKTFGVNNLLILF